MKHETHQKPIWSFHHGNSKLPPPPVPFLRFLASPPRGQVADLTSERLLGRLAERTCLGRSLYGRSQAPGMAKGSGFIWVFQESDAFFKFVNCFLLRLRSTCELVN